MQQTLHPDFFMSVSPFGQKYDVYPYFESFSYNRNYGRKSQKFRL